MLKLVPLRSFIKLPEEMYIILLEM